MPSINIACYEELLSGLYLLQDVVITQRLMINTYSLTEKCVVYLPLLN